MTRIRNGLAMLFIVLGIAARPRYWWVGFRVARRMVPTRWWTQRPYLPLPRRDYVQFRLETQYGGGAPRASLPDVLKYLRWVQQWDSAS